eukprot:2938818-Rhodomonas_salina.1
MAEREGGREDRKPEGACEKNERDTGREKSKQLSARHRHLHGHRHRHRHRHKEQTQTQTPLESMSATSTRPCDSATAREHARAWLRRGLTKVWSRNVREFGAGQAFLFSCS